ncbi:anthranilate synthase component I [Thermocrinis minervae]|uniref:Anthranilate synthase component 1 n=1 Tax=Thermocrinis minervae TaxID=381751 RepID=A0A1M6T7B4_9AQUI|nr:anthranilate synthase component I [Thermocrinis minervae]SHK52766.1 anthranilate synthase component 1 [Thermocrinis minervae]
MLNLSLEEFLELSRTYNIIPLYKDFLADTETPLSIFLKTQEKGKFNILLESAEGGIKWGRYSFIILGGSFYCTYRKGIFEIIKDGRVEHTITKDPFSEIKKILEGFIPYQDSSLGRFWGGLVGYIGYDLIKLYEPVEDQKPDPISVYDMFMIFTDRLIVHDNLTGKVRIIVPVRVSKDAKGDYERAVREIDRCSKEIFTRCVYPKDFKEKEPDLKGWESNFSKEDFMKAVERAKEYIAQGDAIQVVLSQRFKRTFTGNPQDVYRVLRFLNPSPYMYCMDLGSLQVVGSSPEVLVRLEGNIVQTRPIAGTRRRGTTEEEDILLEEELLRDEKERAEHLMLVDLARNDLGKVCKPGTVKVSSFMRVERYSHVMHMVSDVEGELMDGMSPVDVLKATFPAGTVSGAPKVRAMQIIEELEPERRGVYAGAVGYFSFQGNMDMAIAIRTAIFRGGEVFVQAGAGVVADSDPEKEWWETVNKAKAIMKAIHMAEDT